MNKYTVQYRLQGAYLKKEIKNVVEDGYIDGMPVRFFICEDKTRVEIPATAEFYFGKDRDDFIYARQKEWEAEEDKKNKERAEQGAPLPGLAFPTRFNQQ